MKWITREHVKVDRVACPWLIKKFVDKGAEFLFVPTDKVMSEAERQGATPYDVKGVGQGMFIRSHPEKIQSDWQPCPGAAG